MYEAIANFFNINTVFFTIWNYPMSHIEFWGTLFNIWCVYLTAKGKISSWGVGLVGIVLYMFLFYQIQLYSDLTEQIYFLVMSFYGWYIWLHPRNKEDSKENNHKKVSHNSVKSNWIYVGAIIVGTIALGFFMSKIHLIFPTWFTIPASFPYLDAFTTVMSFAATILMAHKKIECWYLWILVDIIGIGLYFAKDVKFISAEYLLFLILATIGLIKWLKEYKTYGNHKKLA